MRSNEIVGGSRGTLITRWFLQKKNWNDKRKQPQKMFLCLRLLSGNVGYFGKFENLLGDYFNEYYYACYVVKNHILKLKYKQREN